jgi:LPXTG-motif cell wall-anchored protein
MRTTRLRLVASLSILALTAMAITFTGHPASAAEPSVALGNAGSYVVLAATTVTNTGLTTVSGDLGVSPGTAVTGFGPGIVSNGTIHSADEHAAAAQASLTAAYNSAAGRATNVTVSADLGGQTLVGGVYTGGALGLTGTVTLDAQNVANTVWIFQAASTLITAPASRVLLVNGANPCNVFWQVGSSATLDTTTTFVGSILALTSIGLNTGATVQGRLLARNGAVTLDTNVITSPDCTPAVTTTAEATSTTAADTTTTEAPTTTVADTTTTVADTTTTVADTTTTTAGTGAVTTTIAPETTTTEASGGVTTTIAPETTTTAGAGSVTTSTAIAGANGATTTAPAPTTTVALAGGTTTTAVPAVPNDRITPRTPLTPGAPGTPGTPTTPGTPQTPGSPELPRTGRNVGLLAGIGTLILVLGGVLVRWSRRNDDDQPRLAW